MKMSHINKQGFSLVEITLALSIAAFSLTAIFGLLPVGLNNNQSSIQQTVAVNLASGIEADVRQAPADSSASSSTATKSSTYNVAIPTNTAGTTTTTLYLNDGGTATTSPNGSSRYKAVVTLNPPPSGMPKAATRGSITVSWPATAPNPLGSVITFLALDRN